MIVIYYISIAKSSQSQVIMATIILINMITTRTTKKRLTVCCTHLKAKKGFEDVRLAQAGHLVDIIKVEKEFVNRTTTQSEAQLT